VLHVSHIPRCELMQGKPCFLKKEMLQLLTTVDRILAAIRFTVNIVVATTTGVIH